MVDPASVLEVADTNSAARPADRGTPRPDDTGYRTFLRAFNLRDLVDMHPISAETYSRFKATARSRIHTVACHKDATVAVASYHYWGSTLLSDHHVPLLLTITHPVIQLEIPCPHTVSRTSWARWSSRRRMCPTFGSHGALQAGQQPPTCPGPLVECLQCAIYGWAKATDRVWTLNFRHYCLRLRPAERAPPLAVPTRAVPGAQHAPLDEAGSAMAQNMLRGCVTVGHVLKRSLVVLGEAQRQQSLREIRRRCLRQPRET